MRKIDLVEAKEALTGTEYSILLSLYDKVRKYCLKNNSQKFIGDYFKDHLKSLGYQVFDLNNTNFTNSVNSSIQSNLPVFENDNNIDYKEEVEKLTKKGYTDKEIKHIIFSAEMMNIPVKHYLQAFI